MRNGRRSQISVKIWIGSDDYIDVKIRLDSHKSLAEAAVPTGWFGSLELSALPLFRSLKLLDDDQSLFLLKNLII